MRNITKVIHHLLENVIPKDHKCRNRVKAIASQACYTPPEMQHNMWKGLSLIFIDELGQPDCDWKIRVQDVMSGKEGIPE